MKPKYHIFATTEPGYNYTVHPEAGKWEERHAQGVPGMLRAVYEILMKHGGKVDILIHIRTRDGFAYEPLSEFRGLRTARALE